MMLGGPKFNNEPRSMGLKMFIDVETEFFWVYNIVMQFPL